MPKGISRPNDPLPATLRLVWRDRPVSVLRLSGRGTKLLERQGINSIGKLIDVGWPWGIPLARVKALEDIKDALSILSRAVQADGNVDWLRYGASRTGDRAGLGKRISSNRKRRRSSTLKLSVLDRSIRVLRLGTRGINLLERSGVNSIGQLIDFGYPWGLGPGAFVTLEDIEDSLLALSEAIQDDGDVDWLRYAACRRTGDSGFAITKAVKTPELNFNSNLLGGLAPYERRASVKALHLSARPVTALRKLGVNTIGNLINLPRDGSVKLPAAGAQTIREIESAIDALVLSVGLDGAINWERFASCRNLLLLPKDEQSPVSVRTFLRTFTEIANLAVESCYGSRGILVIRHYLRQATENVTSLGSLGQELGQTRQAARLLRDKVLTMLKEAILHDNYCDCQFRFRDSFVAPIRQLDRALDEAKRDALLYSEWDRVVRDAWGLKTSELGVLEGLLLAILDYRVVRLGNRNFLPIVVRRGTLTSPFTATLRGAERLLRTRFPAGLPEAELIEQLRVVAPPGLTIEQLSTFIASLHGVERSGLSGRVRMRVDRLSYTPDQLERILRERGRPMHIQELALKLMKFKGRVGKRRTQLQVRTALSHDQRFKHIGRIGLWALSEWDLETGTVADVAASCLSKAQRALTELELHALITARRPVKIRSIMSLLREDGRFRRVASRTWELK